jgi:hypothetical protein
MTDDFHQPREWLQQLMDCDYQTSECGFVEPTLKFELFNTSSTKTMLRVSVSSNSSNYVESGDTFIVEVPLAEIPFLEI